MQSWSAYPRLFIVEIEQRQTVAQDDNGGKQWEIDTLTIAETLLQLIRIVRIPKFLDFCSCF